MYRAKYVAKYEMKNITDIGYGGLMPVVILGKKGLK